MARHARDVPNERVFKMNGLIEEPWRENECKEVFSELSRVSRAERDALAIRVAMD